MTGAVLGLFAWPPFLTADSNAPCVGRLEVFDAVVDITNELGHVSPRNRDAFNDAAAAAKAVCAMCPLLADCRSWVVGNPQRFGVWGGMTPREVRALVNAPAKPVKGRSRLRTFKPGACGTQVGYSRHWDAGQPACVECRAAKAAKSRADRTRSRQSRTKETA